MPVSRKNQWSKKISPENKRRLAAQILAEQSKVKPTIVPPASENPEFTKVSLSGKSVWVNMKSGHSYTRHKNGSKGAWEGIFHRTGGPKGGPWINDKVPEPQVNLLGLNATPATTAKSNNLLTFPTLQEELATINFSKGTMNAANFKKFTNAGINIEEETIQHLTPNQRNSLFMKLKNMNKQNHNDAINSFLANVLQRKGGKRKTQKRRNKTRKH